MPPGARERGAPCKAWGARRPGRSASKLERTLDVRTGEAVAIEYELAGLGSRFLAVAVDFIAQIVLLIVVGLLFLALRSTIEHLAPEKYLNAILGAIAVVLVFLVFFVWFIGFELWWGGRTPGKRALGIRVVRDGGFPVDAGAAIIRNLVRMVEVAFGFYTISAISALISKENKRLGDFAAGTIVVRDRVVAPLDLDAYLDSAARTDTGMREADRVLAERFLARRSTLEPFARARIASKLADRIRPTLLASYGNLDDEGLLEFLTGQY
jgi:uncharacterized RDD family membrane protein YckC